jgi:hypothetical protein
MDLRLPPKILYKKYYHLKHKKERFILLNQNKTTTKPQQEQKPRESIHILTGTP